jgi:hypothetical protein
VTDLDVRAAPEALSYLEEIAQEMVSIFQISLEEARGRINRELRDRTFFSPLEINVLLHEEQDVWANHIYYGRESCWWLGAEGLAPQEYP